MSLSVNISGREMGFYNTSSKASNTHLLRQLEKFWPLPPGYDFEKSIDIGENKTEHIKGNIENLNMS